MEALLDRSNGDEGRTGSASLDMKEEESRKMQDVKPSRKRKKKVEIACVYCRRSHMICDNSRPCQRCIKRGIGHLCYDEPSNARQSKKAAAMLKENTGDASLSSIREADDNKAVETGMKAELPDTNKTTMVNQPARSMSRSILSQTLPYNQEPFFYSEHAGSEFSSLNDFLSIIDDVNLVNGALDAEPNAGSLYPFDIESTGESARASHGTAYPTGNRAIPENNQQADVSLNPVQMNPESNPSEVSNLAGLSYVPQNSFNPNTTNSIKQGSDMQRIDSASQVNDTNYQRKYQPFISDSARDKFFLTAADPTTEISPEERLKQVIKAKLEAGLLQPYNYAKGYARLQNYMDNHMNASSRQRILKPLSIFRPAFRAIARTLKDVDLVLVEENFERMLLDYDRVFTSMAIPACLWRRTGEIYRGNKEFASLVGVLADDLKDGKLAIYELMSEESAVNFWEKYGAIAFDKGQKAVLTSCNLKSKTGIRRKSCCFSFTIRRDRYNIPSCIVGNFIPIDP